MLTHINYKNNSTDILES